MIKDLLKFNVFTRPMIIAFLVIISLVMTTGTFAYWAIEVESAETSTQDFVQIGTQLEGTTWYEIINTEDPCEYISEFLVPHEELIDSKDIDAYEFIYTVCGIDDNNNNQIIEVDYEFVIYKNGKLANDNFYNKLMKYINIELDFIEYSEGNYEYSYKITIDEDLPQNVLTSYSKADIYILFDYDNN